MDFGITLATAADSWKIVKRAEELGYTYVERLAKETALACKQRTI